MTSNFIPKAIGDVYIYTVNYNAVAAITCQTWTELLALQYQETEDKHSFWITETDTDPSIGYTLVKDAWCQYTVCSNKLYADAGTISNDKTMINLQNSITLCSSTNTVTL